MISVSYYLPKFRKQRSSIMLNISFDSYRLQISSGLSTDTQYCIFETNKKKQPTSKLLRFKSSYAEAMELNRRLELLKTHIIQVYTIAKTLEVTVNPKYIKDQVDEFLHRRRTVLKKASFTDHMNEFLHDREKSQKFQESTNVRIRTSLNHLLQYQKDTSHIITYDDMNEEFCDRLFVYLTGKKKLTNNSAETVIRNLKTFLNYAFSKGWTKNTSYVAGFQKSLSHFTVKKESDSVALTLEELKLLENLEGLSKKYRQVRDLFLILCYTSMRYSDLNNLKSENVSLKDGVIVLNTIKTNRSIIIPIHKKLRSILENYPNGRLPKISNQKFNDYIKDICKMAGIDSPVQITTFYGKKRVELTYPKYQLVGSHTGRRTFVTLMLRKGVLAEDVMKISGHLSRASFQKYVKATQEQALINVKNAWE